MGRVRPVSRIAVLGVLLLMAACGSTGTPAHRPDPGGYPHTTTPSAHSTGAANGALRVYIDASPGPRPREGYRPWLRLSRGGHSWRPAVLTQDTAIFTAPPGRYTLRAGIRLCNASCQNLDPPSSTCHARVTVVGPGVAVIDSPAVKLRVRGHCTIGRLA